jgi:hypothetical protein
LQRLIAAARPEPARQTEDAAQRSFEWIVAQLPSPARPKPSRRPLRTLSFAGAGLAVSCLAVSAVALLQSPESPLPPAAEAVPMASARAIAIQPTAGPDLASFAPPTTRRNPHTRAAHRSAGRTRMARFRPEGTSHVRQVEPSRTEGIDAQLSQILVVTSTEPRPQVSVSTAPNDGESYSRVAVYNAGEEGVGVASECVIACKPSGEQTVRVAAQADSSTPETPYLSVESVPAAEPARLDAAATDAAAGAPEPEAPAPLTPEPAGAAPSPPVEPGAQN